MLCVSMLHYGIVCITYILSNLYDCCSYSNQCVNQASNKASIVRECLTGGFLCAVSHESFVPLQAEQHAAPRD